MRCPSCGFINMDGAKFCQKCGNSLNNYTNLREVNTYSQYMNHNSNKKDYTVLIIAITAIIIALIIGGTFLLLSDNSDNIASSEENNQNTNHNNNQNNNQDEEIVIYNLNINNASFYLDGNPNTGITTTINVGKEHAGESIGVMTIFSRDSVNMNHPSEYEFCVVNEEGVITFTDYTPIPKYPDNCMIKLNYNNQIFQFACDMSKRKGYQTSVPSVTS